VWQAVAVPEAGALGIPVRFHPIAVDASFGGGLRVLAKHQNCRGDEESGDQGSVPRFDGVERSETPVSQAGVDL
jgi:hypothetical protein